MPSSKSLSIYSTSGENSLFVHVGKCLNTGVLLAPENPPVCLIQAPAGESSRQKGGHHRVHPLPVSLQGDTHQGFLQAVWGIDKNSSGVFSSINNIISVRLNMLCVT